MDCDVDRAFYLLELQRRCMPMSLQSEMNKLNYYVVVIVQVADERACS